MTDIFFFGCAYGDQAGHRMHKPRSSGMSYQEVGRFAYTNPWGLKIDGSLAPDAIGQIEGQALLHHKDGWTAVAFWDRTGDHRGGSNSVFLAKGEFTFDEMLDLAREAFPEIMKTFKFKIVELL